MYLSSSVLLEVIDGLALALNNEDVTDNDMVNAVRTLRVIHKKALDTLDPSLLLATSSLLHRLA